MPGGSGYRLVIAKGSTNPTFGWDLTLRFRDSGLFRRCIDATKAQVFSASIPIRGPSLLDFLQAQPDYRSAQLEYRALIQRSRAAA